MSISARFTLTRGAFTLDADLRAPALGVTAVFGPSGSGKTTLLRSIAGLERCPGSCRINGEVWQDDVDFTPPHRRPLGYVFQEPSLFDHLTVRGNLEYGMKRVPAQDRRVTLDDVVALLGVSPLMARATSALSGGERQRVAIARALLASPHLLLLDEPLAALDDDSKAEILPFLERLHQELEIPVIYVSHARDEVARLADHLALMEAGRIVAAGPVADMLTRLDLPLANGRDAEAVVEATVDGRDEDDALNYLDFPGGRFTVAGPASPRGAGVRLRVFARDVSITLEQQSGTSILNIFRGTVDEISLCDAGQATVRLDVGGTTLLSRITRRSVAALGLAPGKEVHIQVKSVALLT